MSSTELLDAASISMTSSDAAAAIARQESHSPHGDTVGPWTQFSDAARIFAIDVLPVPREPTNRYAWWTLSCSMALRSVRTTWSWPTTSAKVRGRWRRYSEAEAVTGRSILVAARTAESGPCTLRRERSPSASTGCKLRSGDPASPAGDRLRLLPSGPDLVHGPTSRGTRPSTPQPARSTPEAASLRREFSPARADCGFRAPLHPRLARSAAHGTAGA